MMGRARYVSGTAFRCVLGEGRHSTHVIASGVLCLVRNCLQSTTSLPGQGHRPAGTFLEASAGATGQRTVTWLRQGIAELLIHSLLTTLWRDFTCLGQQIGAEEYCQGITQWSVISMKY